MSKSLAYVLHSSTLGVFLGESGSAVFWSRLQPAPQEAAPCFDDPQQIESMVNAWGPLPPDVAATLAPVEVVPDLFEDGRRYASPAACIAAGLAGWVTPYTARAHTFIYGERPRVH